MSEAVEQTDETPGHVKSTTTPSIKRPEEASITILDGFRIVFGLFLLNFLASYFITGDSLFWGYRPWWSRPGLLAAKLKGPIILTDAELATYAGQNESLPIYLALNATLYDVSAGRRVYGPGGPYNHFAGVDAARAFITGCFAEDSISDWRGAEWTFIPQDVPRFTETADRDLSDAMRDYRYEMVATALKEVEGTIEHWAKVFRGETGKDYLEIGYVKRENGWMNKMPIRSLCAPAEKKRPKAKFDEAKTYKQRSKREKARLANSGLREEEREEVARHKTRDEI